MMNANNTNMETPDQTPEKDPKTLQEEENRNQIYTIWKNVVRKACGVVSHPSLAGYAPIIMTMLASHMTPQPSNWTDVKQASEEAAWIYGMLDTFMKLKNPLPLDTKTLIRTEWAKLMLTEADLMTDIPENHNPYFVLQTFSQYLSEYPEKWKDDDAAAIGFKGYMDTCINNISTNLKLPNVEEET